MKKTGIELISIERAEQIEKHGRTVELDMVENENYELSYAAHTLCMFEKARLFYRAPNGWNRDFWQRILKKSYKDRLIIAGALIAAEIDRLQAEEFNKEADCLRSTDGGH